MKQSVLSEPPYLDGLYIAEDTADGAFDIKLFLPHHGEIEFVSWIDRNSLISVTEDGLLRLWNTEQVCSPVLYQCADRLRQCFCSKLISLPENLEIQMVSRLEDASVVIACENNISWISMEGHRPEILLHAPQYEPLASPIILGNTIFCIQQNML